MRSARALALKASIACATVIATAIALDAQHDASAVAPWLSGSHRAVLDTGKPVVDVPSERGSDFAVRAAIRASVQPARFIAWTREVEQLRSGKYAPQIRRFSAPPRLEDVATLVLEDQELDDLRGCKPGRCSVKLSADEITKIADAARAAGAGWKNATLHAYREVVVARARDFLTRGLASAVYHDHKTPTDIAAEFNGLMTAFARDPMCTPRIAEYLRSFPRHRAPVESLLYWSKDALGDAKPILSIMHLAIFRSERGEPTSAVASQVYASHYLTASVSITSLVATPDERAQLVIYSRRSRTDVFEGVFGGIIRRIVNRRVRSEGAPLLEALRRKVEGGDPAER